MLPAAYRQVHTAVDELGYKGTAGDENRGSFTGFLPRAS
jgi:hypothetical protein